MSNQRPTYHELEAFVRDFTEKTNKTISNLKAEHAHQVDAQNKGIILLRNRLAYYENSNTPTSSRLLEYMKEKRKIRKARENGELLPSKKPGGRPGHKGASRKHNPTSTVKHTMKNTKCSCGSTIIGCFVYCPFLTRA